MPQIEKLMVLGEQLCLDFVNSLGNHLNKNMYRDYLTSYSTFVQWSQKVEIINADEADFFLKESNKKSLEANDIFKRVIELRESFFRILLAVISKNAPEQKHIDLLNREIEHVLPFFSELQYTDNTFVWNRIMEPKQLDWMLSIIVNDITKLLTSNKLDRLKICCDDHCGWIFLDMSKNKSRRWCSMKECGNRAKARQHYHKTKA